MGKKAGPIHFLDVAKYYESIMDACGITQTELASRIGIGQSTVANSLKLLVLSPLLQEMIRNSQLTYRHTRELVRLPNDELRKEAFLACCESSLSVNELKNVVDGMLISPPRKGRSYAVKMLTRMIKWSVNMLVEKGLSVKCFKRDKDSYVDIIVRISK